jgi:hypothetical protein
VLGVSNVFGSWPGLVRFGDTVKIGPVTKKCEVPTLLYECRAFARACK